MGERPACWSPPWTWSDAANDNAPAGSDQVEQAEETTGTVSADDVGLVAGYPAPQVTWQSAPVEVSGGGVPRQRFLKDPYHKDQFTYNEPSDSFRCPQGQTLKFVRIQHANGVPSATVLRAVRRRLSGMPRPSNAWTRAQEGLHRCGLAIGKADTIGSGWRYPPVSAVPRSRQVLEEPQAYGARKRTGERCLRE